MVRSSSATSALALPEASTPARRRARRAFVTTTWASLMLASAMVANSAVKTEHLVFGLSAAPPQPRPDLMGTAAHRAGAVPKAGAPGQTERPGLPATVLVSLATPLVSKLESVG